MGILAINWKSIVLDLSVGLPKRKHGHDNIQIAMIACTNEFIFSLVKPMMYSTTNVTILFLWENCKFHGVVKEIVCDHYIGFVNQFMLHSPKSDNCENIYVFENIFKNIITIWEYVCLILSTCFMNCQGHWMRV